MGIRRIHVPATIALMLGLGVHAANGQKIYWTDTAGNSDKIQRANLDGSNVETLVTTGLQTPTSIAVDRAAGKIYWVNLNSGTIQRADLDGSHVEDLVTGLAGPVGIALDVGMGKMYWTGNSAIFRANFDGSGIEELVTLGDSLREIALDRVAGKMYWVRWTNPSNMIQRADLDGSNVEDLVTTGLIQLTGLTLDPAGGKMYWTDSTFHVADGKIQRANLDGTNVENLTGATLPHGIDLDIAAGKMYWAEATFQTPRIRRANLDGSAMETIVSLSESGLLGGLSLDLCGDGVIGLKTGEQCDDAGESATCDVDCTPPACGDGVLNTTAGEACDDGFTDECGTCNADCTGPGTGSTCGDGIICPETEVCDDGFTGDCGICNADCAGPGTGSCGDGVLCPETEQCDDGNLQSGDGCDANCRFDLGACCVGAACSVTTMDGCLGLGGAFFGNNSACDVPDADGDGLRDECDGCPDDPNKIAPGLCGCGLDDNADSDGDGVQDCNDICPGVDDAVFAPECTGKIPTVSEWGLLVLTLLLLTGGKICFGRPRPWKA